MPSTNGYLEIRAGSVVIATGCVERPLIFDHNERPGVCRFPARTGWRRTYGLLPGEHAVFSVGDDLGLEAALDLNDLGLRVLGVADCRLDGQGPELIEALRQRNIPFVSGWVASKAHGHKVVEGVTISSIDGVRQGNSPVTWSWLRPVLCR